MERDDFVSTTEKVKAPVVPVAVPKPQPEKPKFNPFANVVAKMKKMLERGDIDLQAHPLFAGLPVLIYVLGGADEFWSLSMSAKSIMLVPVLTGLTFVLAYAYHYGKDAYEAMMSAEVPKAAQAAKTAEEAHDVASVVSSVESDGRVFAVMALVLVIVFGLLMKMMFGKSARPNRRQYENVSNKRRSRNDVGEKQSFFD